MIRALLIASVFSAIAAAPAWADCKLNKMSDVKPIIEQDHLYVPGKVNDKPVLFLLDTGSSQTALFNNAAASLGLTVSGYGSQQVPGAKGVAGETTKTDFRATIDTLDIAGLSGKNTFLRVIDRSDDTKLGGLPVVGLMGEDVLSRSDVEISIKDGIFALYHPDGCENANLAHWTKDYNIAAMIHPDQPGVTLSGKLNDSPIEMQIASGIPYSVVSFDAAGSRGVGPGNPGTREIGTIPGVQAEPSEGWVGSFGSFALDEEKIAPAKIAFVRFPKIDVGNGSRLAQAALGANLLLGFDFLRAHHVLISHSQQKVYFSYAGGAPFSAPKPTP